MKTLDGFDESAALLSLRNTLASYFAISDDTWQAMVQFCQFRALVKQQLLYRQDEMPRSYSYVVKGLIRGFVWDDKGNEYNKMPPPVICALWQSTPA